MTTKYVIGQEVEIQNQKGIIKFIGNTEFAPGLWVGIELDSSTGRNDGTINGVKYFDCKPSHGIFVRESFLSIQNQNLKFNFDDEMKKKVEVHGLLLETLHKNSALNQKIEELEEKIKQKGQPGKAFLSEQEKRDEIARLQKEKFLLQREIERFTIEKNILKKNIQQLQDILKAEEPKIVVESNLELWSEISKITKQIDEERVQSQVLENKNNSLMQNIQNARQTAKQQNDELKETLKKKEAYIQKVSESKKNLRDLLSSKGYMRRTSSSTRKIKNKIKQLEAEIRAKKKIVLGIELGKSEHKREMEAVLEVPDEIDRSDWETKVMKRHPEILELRERVKPLHRAVSFSRYYCGAKTEVVDGLTKDVVTQLIMQHYDFYDKKEIRHFIEEKTSIQCITDAENLWDLVMGSPNTEEMTIEERYDLFQDRADKMGLDFVMENDTPIWEEGPDNPKNITFSHNKEEEDDSKKVDFLSTISAANINKLVEKLTYEKGGDPKFVQAMLMTYQSFMKPEHLLFKLIQRYQVPPYDSERSESEKDWLRTKDVIQLRVASIINLWIQKHPGDFDAKLISKLERFLSQYLKFDKPGMEEKIRAQINKIKEGEDLFIEKGMTFAEQPPEPKVPANIFSKTLKLSDLDEEEFARQVTLFVFSTFRKIQPSELVLQAWSKPKLKHKAP
ncbi:ras guanine nucleotide exchange factor a [Anaeramoeba ignava]|uniref:Ras guanine nucleotide exchange factor a n=1 Tax=Anaeramoeba ignava TaxID=1746090 RepID=A0A9Q0LHJ1_ANAIG|nr:ras guanine nucleotide exchange factor a [Anaeramoeba ignava]